MSKLVSTVIVISNSLTISDIAILLHFRIRAVACGMDGEAAPQSTHFGITGTKALYKPKTIHLGVTKINHFKKVIHNLKFEYVPRTIGNTGIEI